MHRRFTAILLFALGGLGAFWISTQEARQTAPALTSPRLSLVEREGRPWLLWEGMEPSGVVFQMENRNRVETIGVATHPALQQVVELSGWFGSGPVRIHARPDHGPTPPPLTVHPRDLEVYLDLLASRALRRRSEEAWRRLGRFSELYFSSGMGDPEIKRDLQARLVREGEDAGPGGARWLWGPVYSPSSETSLPGSSRVEAEILGERSCGLEGDPVEFRFPQIEGSVAELDVQIEVSPTPARGYWLELELENGWRARFQPGDEGGFAFQRVDLRAFQPGQVGGTLRVRSHAGVAPELRVSLVTLGLRLLPLEESDNANS